MSQCRSCDAAIVWVVTPNDKRMPLDAAPNREKGTVRVDNGIGVTLSGRELKAARLEGRTLYLSHHATCPRAAQNRRPR